jgi:hypothetical protein
LLLHSTYSADSQETRDRHLSLNRIIYICRLQTAQIAEKSRIVNELEIKKSFKSRPPDI